MSTHRVHLHHVGIPGVETNAHIVIAIVALGSCTIDMTILWRSNKSVHCVELLYSQQQNVNESKKRDYYLGRGRWGYSGTLSGGNWTSAIYQLSVRLSKHAKFVLSPFILSIIVWFRFMYLIAFYCRKNKSFRLKTTWYETYALSL